jgi:alpha-galactosidase
MSVGADRRRAIVGLYRVLNRPVPGPDRLRLRGLDPDARYRVSLWPATGDALERANAIDRGGDDLMSVGLLLATGRDDAAARGDFWSRLFVLEVV